MYTPVQFTAMITSFLGRLGPENLWGNVCEKGERERGIRERGKGEERNWYSFVQLQIKIADILLVRQ